MPVERPLQKTRELPEAGISRPFGRGRDPGKDRVPGAVGERFPGEILELVSVDRHRRLETASIPGVSASIAPAIACRSTESSSARQTSKISTTRSSSLGFSASCSMVSSNTKASAFRQ